MSDPGFVVGGYYANSAGEYEVLEIEGGTVRLRYANGFEMKLPSQGLWSQWETIVQERTGRPPAGSESAARSGAGSRAGGASRTATSGRSSGAGTAASSRSKKAVGGDAGFYTAAGYLAAGCTLTASVAGRDYAAFAQRYQIHTGRSLITPHEGLDVHERPTHKIAAELAARFPATPDALSHFDLGAKPERDAESGEYVVKRAELVERLLKLGFDLGPNTDPWPIRERVPEAQRVNFDRGLTLRGALRG